MMKDTHTPPRSVRVRAADREALACLILGYDPRELHNATPHDWQLWGRFLERADVIIASDVWRNRRQGPITDEAVEAALSAFWTAIDDDPVIDPGDLLAMRAALEAAERARSAVPSTTEPSSSAFSGGGAGYGKADYPEESS